MKEGTEKSIILLENDFEQIAHIYTSSTLYLFLILQIGRNFSLIDSSDTSFECIWNPAERSTTTTVVITHIQFFNNSYFSNSTDRFLKTSHLSAFETLIFKWKKELENQQFSWKWFWTTIADWPAETSSTMTGVITHIYNIQKGLTFSFTNSSSSTSDSSDVGYKHGNELKTSHLSAFEALIIKCKKQVKNQ